MVDPVNAIVCSFALAAAIGVVDEDFLENRRYAVENIMVDNAVTEIRGKYLALYRFVNDEADAFPRFIIATMNFIEQFKYVGFKMFLKGKSVDRIPLVFPGVKIGLKQIVQQFVFVYTVEK